MEISLPMPGQEDDDDDDYDEDGEDGEWDDGYYDEPPDADGVPLELPEPMSEDEQFNGVNMPPVSGYQPDIPSGDPDHQPRAPRSGGQRPRRKRQRMPPMPDVPRARKRKAGETWHPPFEVAPDGTVLGVPVSKDGSPPIEELPEVIMEDGTRTVLDPGKGSLEGVSQIFRGR